MSFASDLAAFQKHVEQKQRALFVNTASAVKSSITDGSALTGAPGSPVDTGALKASWQIEFESPTRVSITTNIAYAPAVEDASEASYDPTGVTPEVPDDHLRPSIKSTVGGPHSVKLTRAGFQRIVDDEARKLGAVA